MIRANYAIVFSSEPTEYPDLCNVFFEKLDVVDEELGKDQTGPYFFGSQFTLADINLIPTLERMEGVMTYLMGMRIRESKKWPNINKLMNAMETRESFIATRADYYTNAHVTRMFAKTMYLNL